MAHDSRRGRRLAILVVACWKSLDEVVRHAGQSTQISDVVGGWCRFDCTWYVDIADRGYTYVPGHQSSVAFFPGYPLVVRGFDAIIGNPIVSRKSSRRAGAIRGVGTTGFCGCRGVGLMGSARNWAAFGAGATEVGPAQRSKNDA